MRIQSEILNICHHWLTSSCLFGSDTISKPCIHPPLTPPCLHCLLYCSVSALSGFGWLETHPPSLPLPFADSALYNPHVMPLIIVNVCFRCLIRKISVFKYKKKLFNYCISQKKSIIADCWSLVNILVSFSFTVSCLVYL